VNDVRLGWVKRVEVCILGSITRTGTHPEHNRSHLHLDNRNGPFPPHGYCPVFTRPTTPTTDYGVRGPDGGGGVQPTGDPWNGHDDDPP